MKALPWPASADGHIHATPAEQLPKALPIALSYILLYRKCGFKYRGPGLHKQRAKQAHYGLSVPGGMNVCMNEQRNEGMEEYMPGWMHGQMDKQMAE